MKYQGQYLMKIGILLIDILIGTFVAAMFFKEQSPESMLSWMVAVATILIVVYGMHKMSTKEFLEESKN